MVRTKLASVTVAILSIFIAIFLMAVKPPPTPDAIHIDLATDHDGLGLASEHTGLTTDNDGLATDHDALGTDHDALALGAPASELVTLINNETIELGSPSFPIAIDVSDVKSISLLASSTVSANLQGKFISSSGIFTDNISSGFTFQCTLFNPQGIQDINSIPCSSKVHGPFFVIRVSVSSTTTVTVQAWLQK